MIHLVLFASVLTLAACSTPAPLSPHPAGKANCALCEFLGDDKYTIAEGQGGHESPDSSPATKADTDSTQADSATKADADSTQADSATKADADSTQADSDCPLCGFLGDDRYTAADAFFPDSNLERAVRQALGRPQGRLIPEDMASLTQLRADRKNVHSLVGIEHFTALQSLSLFSNQITDLGPLANLTNLQWLELRQNKIVDVGPLANLTGLKWLWLENNQIVDIGPLANLTNLQALGLEGNQITDLGPLANLTNLINWEWLD